MGQKYSSFSYKSGNSFLHRMPAWIKILLIPAINILFLCLPPLFSVILFIVQLILSFCLKFSLKEQYQDLKPVLYYAVLLYLFSFISGIVQILISKTHSGLFESLQSVSASAFLNKETLFMLLKLFCIMQSASLVYKTSTSLEIREGVGVIELCIRKVFRLERKLKVTNTISLFVTFIPLVIKIWNQSKKAWYARQGKKGVKMYMTLLPVLFSVGLKSAYNSAKAISARD
ncbi:MAG: hypothetical protein SOT46_10075 [Treponema sp.]|nr:hypothetical protein [Treponema sp.]